MPESLSELIDIHIDSLAAGGDGVGHAPDGRVIFVPFVAPGDRVRVRIVEERARLLRGVVEEILEPSPARVPPRCSAFGSCGGCSWQHIDLPVQLSAKVAILRDALVRIGRFHLEHPISITPSPSGYGYRNRARVVEQDGAVGYRKRRSHALCAVDECPVLQEPLERALGRLAQQVRRDKPDARAEKTSRRRQARAVEWELAVGSAGEARFAPVHSPRSARRRRSKPGAVKLRIGDDTLRISEGVFAQGNALLLDVLVGAVCKQAQLAGATSAVELFSGAGLLTLALARAFDCVWAVESNAHAVLDLRVNLRTAGLDNVDVREGDVESVLPRLQVESPDVVVLDPPRIGISEAAMGSLVDLRPRSIVYLSCDPATLARDLARMREQGYQLRHIEAFDLFPQTPHIEALARLEATSP